MKAVGQEERMVRMKILLMLYFECKDEADIVPQKNQSHTPLPPPALSNASFLKTSEWKPDEKTFLTTWGQQIRLGFLGVGCFFVVFYKLCLYISETQLKTCFCDQGLILINFYIFTIVLNLNAPFLKKLSFNCIDLLSTLVWKFLIKVCLPLVVLMYFFLCFATI